MGDQPDRAQAAGDACEGWAWVIGDGGCGFCCCAGFAGNRAAMVKSRLAGYELNTTTTAYSKLISRDIERTVKNTKDVDIAIVFDEIRNPKCP